VCLIGRFGSTPETISPAPDHPFNGGARHETGAVTVRLTDHGAYKLL